jgi:RNA polymerase sigma factor (sigma-70 family)
MDRTYDSLDSYINLAKKTIVKFGPRFYNGLSAEMLKNTDAVSDVATAIMYADWRFDPNRPGKSGQKKTLYSYRNQCAIWAIKTYVTNKYKKHLDTSISLNFSEEGSDSSFYSSISDEKAMDPVDILIDKEESSRLTSSIDQLLNSILSDKQKIQIKMYYLENHTLSYIGKKFGVSREAIRQNIKRALDIIRSYDKCTA